MSGAGVQPALGDSDEERECWCCGTPNAPARLLQLNGHPEVGVCLECARYLALQAGERSDQLRPTSAGRVRDVLRAGRRLVVSHGWQRRPIIGPVLRWIGRFTP